MLCTAEDEMARYIAAKLDTHAVILHCVQRIEAIYFLHTFRSRQLHETPCPCTDSFFQQNVNHCRCDGRSYHINRDPQKSRGFGRPAPRAGVGVLWHDRDVSYKLHWVPRGQLCNHALVCWPGSSTYACQGGSSGRTHSALRRARRALRAGVLQAAGIIQSYL